MCTSLSLRRLASKSVWQLSRKGRACKATEAWWAGCSVNKYPTSTGIAAMSGIPDAAARTAAQSSATGDLSCHAVGSFSESCVMPLARMLLSLVR